jgi:hypothetical protein
VTATLPPPDDEDLAAAANPPARTAGEESHEDPWQYAGEDADPPTDPQAT